MSYDKLMADVNSGRITSLYLLYGEEIFLIDDFLKRLKQKVLSGGAADFNYDCYIAGDVKGAQIRDVVETFPMMSDHRLVVVKNFHQMKENDVAALLPIIENPVETTVLVLVAEKIDKRKKVFKSIAKTGKVVECKRLYDNQVLGWIEQIAKSYRLKISPQAKQLIHQSVGNNLVDIDSEIRKLHQYMGKETEVDVDVVSKVVSRARVESVFELANAIGNNDRVQALTRLANLLDQGQNEVGVLAMVIRHFRILADIQRGIKEGLKGGKLSQAIGVHPYFLDQYVHQSRQWSQRQIDQTFQILLDTDQAIKSSPVSSHIWLENFVLKTCQASA